MASMGKKPKWLRKGDRIIHPSRGTGSITGRMADTVFVKYDSGEEFDYLMDDALEKLLLEDGGGAAPKASASGAQSVEPVMPPRAKARKGSIESSGPPRDEGKKKTLRKGDRIVHPSRGGGSITGRMADMVYVLYDSGEDFEYYMDDAMEKLSLEEDVAVPVAPARATEPPEPPMPSHSKARKGSIETEKPLKEWQKPIVPPSREPPAKKPAAPPPRAVASHRESESHAPTRSSGSHKGRSTGKGPQVAPGPREGNDPCVQLMELPVPMGPADGTGNYRTLLEAWNQGPRTDSNQPLPIPDDEEDGIDELTLSEGDKPSKRLRNPVPLQSLITNLGDIWARDNVL